MREVNCQQGSTEWHQMRVGLITGTRVGRVMGKSTTQDTLLAELLANMMSATTDEDGFLSPAMSRGIDLEPEAVALASKELGFDYETLGMMASTDIKGFATSPDGVVRKDGVIVGGIEVKCPNTANHVDYILKDKVPAKYRFQIFAQFLVCDTMEFYHFMSYDPRCVQKPSFYKVVWRKEILEELEKMEVELRKFIIRLNSQYDILTSF